LALPQQLFEFGENHLNRIEIGAVGRQEDKMGASGTDGVARCLGFVAAEIVENDDVALGQGRSEDLLGIDREELAIDGTVLGLGAEMKECRLLRRNATTP
jgi:hypothetical protein